MTEKNPAGEYMTSEQVFRSISIMCTQQIRFEAEIARLRAALDRTLPRIEDCGDVPRNQQAMDLCFVDKVIALLIDRDQIIERIDLLQQKIERIDVLIDKYRKLLSTRSSKDLV